MNHYKIKINCTGIKNLSYNGKEISTKTYNNVSNKFKIEQFITEYDYINKLVILYKRIPKPFEFVCKTLEFVCNDMISIKDFIVFIKHMKSIGFKSDNNNIRIQFLDTKAPHDPLYEVLFDTHEVLFATLDKPKKKKRKIIKNRSLYQTQILYNSGI